MGVELGVAAGALAACLCIVLLGQRRLERRLRAARAAGRGARYSRQIALRMAAAYVMLGALLCVVGVTEFFVTEGSWPVLGIITFFGLACAAIGLKVLLRDGADAEPVPGYGLSRPDARPSSRRPRTGSDNFRGRRAGPTPPELARPRRDRWG